MMINKWVCYILTLGFAVLLTACGQSDKNIAATSSKNGSNVPGSVFYRIEASYEIIETGEYIHFDYIMSCYNDEVPGSFKGVLIPRNMFKATSAGGAIAISPPKHYCERGIKGLLLEKEDDVLKMPILMWYEDVNDLSYALLYMTNDAYTGPNAKVRFKRYSFSKSDRESFLDWEEKARAEYKQVGAIPGPFGCNSVDSGSSLSCGRDDFVARNNGYYLAVEGQDLYNPHTYKFTWPVNVASDYKNYLNVNHRYYCANAISSQAGKRYKRSLRWGDEGKRPGNLPEHLKSYDTHRRYIQTPLDMRLSVYLDPYLLLTGKGSRPVTEVYPKVLHKHPRTEIKPETINKLINTGRREFGRPLVQVLERPEWRGFAILHYQRPISDYIPEIESPDYEGEHPGALFINNILVCEHPSGNLNFEVYDLSRGKLISMK